MTAPSRFARLAAPLLIAGFVVLASVPADARGFRIAQIPNGDVFGCANCHVNPAGGGARNAFGQQIGQDFLTDAESGFAVVWGPELADLDGDGDGVSNGQELGDPSGAWSAGDAAPGDRDAVTEAWNADSVPPPAATAVTSSSWAQVKALLQPRD